MKILSFYCALILFTSSAFASDFTGVTCMVSKSGATFESQQIDLQKSELHTASPKIAVFTSDEIKAEGLKFRVAVSLMSKLPTLTIMAEVPELSGAMFQAAGLSTVASLLIDQSELIRNIACKIKN